MTVVMNIDGEVIERYAYIKRFAERAKKEVYVDDKTLHTFIDNSFDFEDYNNIIREKGTTKDKVRKLQEGA